MSDTVSPWCEKHWKQASEDPLVNGIAATIALTNVFMRQTIEAKGHELSATEMNEAFRQHSPVCCKLAPEVLAKVFAEGKIGAPDLPS